MCVTTPLVTMIHVLLVTGTSTALEKERYKGAEEEKEEHKTEKGEI
jgi:hypothetical protein